MYIINSQCVCINIYICVLCTVCIFVCNIFGYIDIYICKVLYIPETMIEFIEGIPQHRSFRSSAVASRCWTLSDLKWIFWGEKNSQIKVLL